MTPDQVAALNARLDQLAAEVGLLRGDVQRAETLLNGHMDARALDPGGHLQDHDWSADDEPVPALPQEVA